MIDIFEVQRLIDADPEGSEADTIVMSMNDHKNLNKYFSNRKYKGYYMLAMSILDDGVMYMGKKPLWDETE